MSRLVAVTPWQSLEVAEAHAALLDRPPENDYVIRTLVQRADRNSGILRAAVNQVQVPC